MIEVQYVTFFAAMVMLTTCMQKSLLPKVLSTFGRISYVSTGHGLKARHVSFQIPSR